MELTQLGTRTPKSTPAHEMKGVLQRGAPQEKANLLAMTMSHDFLRKDMSQYCLLLVLGKLMTQPTVYQTCHTFRFMHFKLILFS